VSDVTEADRDKAVEVVEKIAGVPWDVFTEAEWGWVSHIAQALADERAKARAPFLALAEQMGAEGDSAIRYYANRISQMVEDPS